MDWKAEWRERDIPECVWPVVNDKSNWRVNSLSRLAACDNRPGLKKFYITVKDCEGNPMGGIRLRFDVEPSQGQAYDHPNVWGMTDEHGYMEWDHLGVPTRYTIWMEDDEEPLIENIRTDLDYEYCRPPGQTTGGWRPVNRPGVYSYRIEIQRKGASEV